MGTCGQGYDRPHRALRGRPSRYAARPDDGAVEIPALLNRRAKTGSNSGNSTGKAPAAE